MKNRGPLTVANVDANTWLHPLKTENKYGFLRFCLPYIIGRETPHTEEEKIEFEYHFLRRNVRLEVLFFSRS